MTTPYTPPAKKGDPDYLSPHIGGCWHCHRVEPFTDMLFDMEFDTNVHRACIRVALKRDPDDPEVNAQKYLLEPGNEIAGIPPKDMPEHPDNSNKMTEYTSGGASLITEFEPGVGRPDFSTLSAIVEQFELCKFVDNHGHRIETNSAFISLKEMAQIVTEEHTLPKSKIVELLDAEIEFAKGTGMPQFVMGLLQAKKVLVDYIDNLPKED